MAVTSLPVLHHQPEADLATATSIVTGWRHGTVYSITLMVVSSPPLHAHVLHHQPGDLALQEVDLVILTPIMAGWRHGTKRGRLARLSYMILLI